MLVAIHRHKLLVEGNAPKPLFNTEFHSVATRSANAFLSVPSAPFRSIGVRESLTPFANRVRPKIEPPSKDGVAKYEPHLFSSRDGGDGRNGAGSPPSKHRRDRCERRALPDHFKRGCFHHHVGQPDTPSSMFGFILVLHLMFL